MKTRLSAHGALVLATLALAGCGGGSSGGGGRDDAPDPEGSGEPDRGEREDGDARRQPKDCETQWQERVAKTPVGEVKVHDNFETTTGYGDPSLDRTVRSRSRVEVVSADDQAIRIETRWEYFEPDLGVVDGNNDLTKKNFLLTCEPLIGDPSADPDAMARQGITILEDRQEKIEVQAGTFDAHYQKIQVKGGEGSSSNVLGDHWTINDGTVIVKEKTVVSSAVEGESWVRTSESELVEYVRGPARDASRQ